MTADPLAILRLQSSPQRPDPRFAADLRRRIREELQMTASEELSELEAYTTAEGTPVGIIHIRVTDPDRAIAFFGSLFGWESERYEDDTYTAHYVINTVRLTVLTNEPSAPPVRLFFAVDDVDAAMTKVVALGGRVVDSGAEGDGAWAQVEDDQGVPLGIWRPGHDRQTPVPTGPATAEVGYLVVLVPDAAKGAVFYEALLGWRHNPPTPYGYRHVTNAGMPLGINPEDTEAGFLLFFRVDDLDEAIAQVRRLGGTVDDEIEDSPSGRSVGFTDDQGTSLGLWQPAPQY